MVFSNVTSDRGMEAMASRLDCVLPRMCWVVCWISEGVHRHRIRIEAMTVVSVYALVWMTHSMFDVAHMPQMELESKFIRSSSTLASVPFSRGVS